MQLVLTVVMYLLSRKFHPSFGLPGTEAGGSPWDVNRKQGIGWEWYESTSPELTQLLIMEQATLELTPSLFPGGRRSSGSSSGRGSWPRWSCGGHDGFTIPWDGERRQLLVVLLGEYLLMLPCSSHEHLEDRDLSCANDTTTYAASRQRPCGSWRYMSRR